MINSKAVCLRWGEVTCLSSRLDAERSYANRWTFSAKKERNRPPPERSRKNIINKTSPASFLESAVPILDLTEKGRTHPPPKFRFQAVRPVASRANYHYEQRICQRRTQNQEPLIVLSNDLQQKQLRLDALFFSENEKGLHFNIALFFIDTKYA